MKILNLTQHPATPEQIEAGVVDCHPLERERLKALLTFEALTTNMEIQNRAKSLCELTHLAHVAPCGNVWHQRFNAVMIGGAPFLMAPLEAALKPHFKVLYAFSERASVETTKDDGSVVKTNVFKHAGFVEAQ
jgi:hypothetical protein